MRSSVALQGESASKSVRRENNYVITKNLIVMTYTVTNTEFAKLSTFFSVTIMRLNYMNRDRVYCNLNCVAV